MCVISWRRRRNKSALRSGGVCIDRHLVSKIELCAKQRKSGEHIQIVLATCEHREREVEHSSQRLAKDYIGGLPHD